MPRTPETRAYAADVEAAYKWYHAQPRYLRRTKYRTILARLHRAGFTHVESKRILYHTYR